MDPEAVARSFHSRDRSAAAFGIDLVEASPERSVVTMTVTPEMCNGYDIIHGGMTFLLADSAMAFASNCENEVALATSAEIDWLTTVSIGQHLTATAERRHTTGRSTLWDIAVTAEDGTLVAVFRGRTRKVGGPVVEG